MYLAGTLSGFALSVWVCGRAEKLLGKTDPGEIVLDEIVAVPMCFASLLTTLHFSFEGLPLTSELLLLPATWYWVAAGFALFRLFDIWKPGPINTIQKMKNGWGVTMDDVLAGVVVSVILGVAFLLI